MHTLLLQLLELHIHVLWEVPVSNKAERKVLLADVTKTNAKLYKALVRGII